MGNNITSIITSFFNTENLPLELNENLIVLILKKDNPTQTSHFQDLLVCVMLSTK